MWRTTVALTLTAALAGCASGSPHGGSDPYLGAPRIRDAAARSIRLGTPKRKAYRRLGGKSPNGYTGAAARQYSDCWFYPVKGTVRRRKDGDADAVEWMFCFDRHGRVAKKRRFPFGKASDLPPP